MDRTPVANKRASFIPFSDSNAILAIVSGAHAINHAFSTLMPLIYPLVVAEFRLSYSQIGLMVGVANATGGLLQMSFSYLSRFIPRRVLLGGGQLLMAVSTAFTGVANSFGMFFFGNVFARVGGSPQHPVGNSILSDHFETSRRGFALSMHVSGGNVGTVAVPLIGTLVISAFGWRAALLLFAALALLFGLTLIFLVDESRQIDTSTVAPHSGGRWRDIATILSDRNVQLIFVASTIAAGGRGLGVLTTYVPLYLHDSLKLDSTYAGILFTVLLAGSVVGPVLFGRISDAIGRRLLLLAIYAASAIATTLFVLAGSSWLLPVSLLALGIVVYAESPLLQTFLADSTQHLDRDLAFGLYFTVAFGIGAFWASVLGWAIDSFGFAAGFHIVTLSYIVAALVLLPTREIILVRKA